MQTSPCIVLNSCLQAAQLFKQNCTADTRPAVLAIEGNSPPVILNSLVKLPLQILEALVYAFWTTSTCRGAVSNC